jgi:hypothetical protein
MREREREREIPKKILAKLFLPKYFLPKLFLPKNLENLSCR